MSMATGSHRRFVRASVVLICLLLLGCSNSNANATPHPPAWALACLQSPKVASKADPAYIGLTKDKALALADRRGEELVLVGEGGRCVDLGGQVAYASPVAVVFDTGALGSGVPQDSKIVFATSQKGAQYNGWGLSR